MNKNMDVITYARKSLLDEVYSAEIYKRLAELHKNEKSSGKLRKISEMEYEHAEFWRRFLEKRGIKVEKFRINRLKLMLIIILFRILGIGFSIRILESGEKEASGIYSKLLESREPTVEERIKLKKILEDELLHEEELVEEESMFKDFYGSC